MRLLALGAESLWYDEAFSWWVARLEGVDFWTALAGDVHPPLWYLVEWLIVRLLGESEAALRFPSVIFGVIAVLLVYWVAREFTSERGALVAEALAAVMPIAGLYYSNEARMYALLACLCLLTLWAALKGRWLLYVAAAGLALYTQNLALVYIAALGITAILFGPDGRRALLANGIVGIFWLPWAAVMLGQMGAMGQGFWLWPIQGTGELLWPLPALVLGYRVPNVLQMHGFAVVFGMTLLSIIVGRPWLKERRGVLLLAFTFGAPALAALASILWRPVYLPRAFIPTVFGVMVFWGAALVGLSRENRRIAGLLVGAVMIIGLVSYYFPASSNRQDVQGWLSDVLDEWQPGDVIYHTNITMAVLSRYYTPDLPYFLWPRASDLNQALTERTKAAMGFVMADPGELVDLGFRRAWVVWHANPMTVLAEQEETIEFIAAHPNRLVSTLYENALGRVSLYEVLLLPDHLARDCAFAWGPPERRSAGETLLDLVQPLSECATHAR